MTIDNVQKPNPTPFAIAACACLVTSGIAIISAIMTAKVIGLTGIITTICISSLAVSITPLMLFATGMTLFLLALFFLYHGISDVSDLDQTVISPPNQNDRAIYQFIGSDGAKKSVKVTLIEDADGIPRIQEELVSV